MYRDIFNFMLFISVKIIRHKMYRIVNVPISVIKEPNT
jgi:hypothetical protein